MGLRDGGLTRRGWVAGTAAWTALAGGAAPDPARAQGGAPKRGGTLTLPLTPEPPVLVPGVDNQGPTLIAGSKIYQGLLKYSPKLEPLPELAKSWEISEDRRVYTFRLQEGVRFHDGMPMTSEDVVFSVARFHAELSPHARGVFAAIERAEAPDPLTVRLVLKAPFEPFLLLFDATSCAIVPKHVFDGADPRTDPRTQTPIGTGPFRFVEWRRGEFIRLRRFEAYWKPGQPYLDEIVFRVIPDGRSRALAVQTGQVQLAAANDLDPSDVAGLQAQPNLEVRASGWELFAPLMWVELNHRSGPLGDARVRRAIAHALDRDVVQRRVWSGAGKPAGGPIASATRSHDPRPSLPGHDPRAAAELLDAAGLAPDARGVRFTLRHLVVPHGEVWARLADYLRASLRAVGVEVVLEGTDAAGWAGRVADWDYDTTANVLYQYGDPALGVERSYVSSNIRKVLFANTGGYANPRVDEAFARARLDADPAARRQAFAEAQHLLVEDMPQIWLLEMAFPTVSDKRLRNHLQTGTGVHASFDDVFFA